MAERFGIQFLRLLYLQLRYGDTLAPIKQMVQENKGTGNTGISSGVDVGLHAQRQGRR